MNQLDYISPGWREFSEVDTLVDLVLLYEIRTRVLYCTLLNTEYERTVVHAECCTRHPYSVMDTRKCATRLGEIVD